MSITEKIEEYTIEQLDELESQLLAGLARSFTPDGFVAFFELMTGFILPDHHKRAVDALFDAMKKEKGLVVEMFRGAAKTTVFDNAFAAFVIGHHPDWTGFIVQASGESANDNAAEIADYIKWKPGWRLVFPHVVPDEERGWGEKGYNVKRDDISYGEWAKIKAGKKDPTFFGAGYRSTSLIGKRPDWYVLDDINDERNTASERESRRVETLLNGTIFPAANMSKIQVVIGTPWNENDAIHQCLSTGEFEHMKIPVYTQENPTWPEMFPEEKIQKERRTIGEIEFARMYLLDLSKTKGLTLKEDWLRYFPNEDINPDWPIFMGVDFTSTEDPRKRSGDYFCIAVGALVPGKSQLILIDGLRERVSKLEAEEAIVSWSARYPTLRRVGVEAIITGQMFYLDLLNNAELRAAGIYPKPVRFNKSKGHRFEKEMAPMFQSGRMMVSDSHLAFLKHFKDEWMNWQGDALEDMYHNDTLDAVYSLMRAAEGHINPIRASKRNVTNSMYKNKRHKPSKWFDAGRQ
jgi:hypothetical protein